MLQLWVLVMLTPTPTPSEVNLMHDATRASYGINYAQREVEDWVFSTLGSDSLDNTKERLYRFIEEAFELAQALDLSKEDVLKLADQVYEKPKEQEPSKEFSGVLSTLMALASNQQVKLGDAYVANVQYRWANVQAIRAKQAQKKVRAI